MAERDDDSFDAEPLLQTPWTRPSFATRQQLGRSKSNDMESEEFPPIPRASLGLVYFTSFLSSIQYAILMPTVWEYVQLCGGTKFFLGMVLSAFSLSQTLFFAVLGRWSDRRAMREPFFASFVLGVIGNTVYGLAGYEKSLTVMMAGRLVSGMGAANTGLVAAYIARAAPPEQRTKLLGINQMVIFVGILCGPAMAILVYDVHVQHGFLVLDRCTMAGYLMTAMNLLAMLIFPAFFVEPKRQARVKPEGELTELAAWRLSLRRVFLQRKGYFNLMITFIVAFEISALEAALTPITTQQYGWNSKQNSFLFAGIAGVALTAVAIAIVLDKRPWTSPRGIVAGGFATMSASFVVAFVTSGSHMVPFYGLCSFGVLFVGGVMMLPASNMAVYSTKIGEYGKGVFMGYAQIMQGTARIFGPLLAGAALHWSTHWALFGVLAAVFCLGPLNFWRVWGEFHTEGLYDGANDENVRVSRVGVTAEGALVAAADNDDADDEG